MVVLANDITPSFGAIRSVLGQDWQASRLEGICKIFRDPAPLRQTAISSPLFGQTSRDFC